MRIFILALILMGLTHLQAMKIGTNFWNIDWMNPNDIFKSKAFLADGENPFNPTMLQEVGFYKVIRTMDWTPTNNVETVSWATREPINGKQQGRVAWEWHVDLANRVGADLWINVPTTADDAYVTELANLMKTRLNSNHKLYVEWSNETWNWAFPQADYCSKKGIALNLQGDKYEQAVRFMPIRAAQVWKVFMDVFGKDNNRIVKVMASQDGSEWLTGRHLESLKDKNLNPSGLMPDVYATAPYFGYGMDGLDPNLRTKLSEDIHKLAVANRKVRDIVNAENIAYVSYEGGQTIASYATKEGAHSDIPNRDPRMYDMYIQYLDTMSTVYSLFMHYCHSGQAGGQGSWGSLEYTGQPIKDAPKYRALKDWVAAHPDGSVTPVLSAKRNVHTKANKQRVANILGRIFKSMSRDYLRTPLL